LAGVPVSLELLDNTTRPGSLAALDAETVRLEGPPEERISRQEILTLRFTPTPQESAPDASTWVTFRAGGGVVARDVVSDDRVVLIQLADGSSLEIPSSAVAGIAWNSDDPASRRDFLRQSALPRTGDLLIAQRDGEQAQLEGVVGTIDAQGVAFTLDGQTIAVKRPRVRAILFAGTSQSTPILIADALGHLWPASAISADADHLTFTSPDVGQRTMPLTRIARIDLAVDRTIPLTDLEPVAIEHTAYLDTPWPYRRDQGLETPSILLGGVEHPRGLIAHARTRFVYELSGEYRSLRAVVGVEDRAGPLGHAIFRVAADDRILLELPVLAGQTPTPVDVDLTRARRLVLEIDFGPKGDLGDYVAIASPILIKDDAP
jgi:hypothetical protein